MLTDFTIRALQPPEKGEKILHDESLSGFGVRVTKNNVKSFVVTYGRRRRRKTIGRVGIVSLRDARQKAKELLAEITLGKDRPRTLSWNAAVEEFLAAKKEKLRETTTAGYEHALSLCRFGETKLGEITPSDIEKDLAKLKKKPGMRYNTFVILRVFFRWAYKKSYVQANPIDRVETPPAPKGGNALLTRPDSRKL